MLFLFDNCKIMKICNFYFIKVANEKNKSFYYRRSKNHFFFFQCWFYNLVLTEAELSFTDLLCKDS
jgi:hypothetical protein